jgi:hypothetical protein
MQRLCVGFAIGASKKWASKSGVHEKGLDWWLILWHTHALTLGRLEPAQSFCHEQDIRTKRATAATGPSKRLLAGRYN